MSAYIRSRKRLEADKNLHCRGKMVENERICTREETLEAAKLYKSTLTGSLESPVVVETVRSEEEEEEEEEKGEEEEEQESDFMEEVLRLVSAHTSASSALERRFGFSVGKLEASLQAHLSPLNDPSSGVESSFV